MSEPIFHLAEPAAWAMFGEEYRAESLETEGFIHCSTAGQLLGVAQRLYEGRDDLVLLVIDPDALGTALVYEDLYGEDEEYPHVYGPVPRRAVIATGPYREHLAP